jgi:hypothetical protein
MRLSNRLPSFVLVPILFALPAAAQTSVELFREDFESGAARWTMEGFWHLALEGSTCAAEPFPSGTHAAWYGQRLGPGACSYDGFYWDFLHLSLSTPIPLPESSPSTLRFESRSSIEDDPFWDTRTVEISSDGGTTWLEVFRNQTVTEPWSSYSVDLSPFAGETILVRFVFWVGDGVGNDDLGWIVDDVVVESTSDYPVSCLGDGSATACPCGNSSSSADQAGCRNSQGTPGALRATGVASLSNDTLRLWGSGMTNTTALYYQGASLVNGGAGHVYGDGLNCTGGPIRRIGSTTNVAGDSSVGDSISVRGQVAVPGTRWYQARYRNASNFCTPATFNSTNQVRVDWTL